MDSNPPVALDQDCSILLTLRRTKPTYRGPLKWWKRQYPWTDQTEGPTRRARQFTNKVE